MQATVLVLSLGAIISCLTVVATFNRCDNGDTCIDIRECHLFGPHHTQHTKWLTSQKEDFRARFCAREQTFDEMIHKVCCPKSPSMPSTGGSKRGLDLLDLDGCGLSSNRDPTKMNNKSFQHPWMAMVHTKEEFVCGGTLINNRYVLTAAHCVRNVEPAFVRLGEYELNRTIDCDRKGCAVAPQDIPIERTIIHEDYNIRRKENDIALLRLTHEATMNDNVVPICLPVTPAMKTNLPTYLMTGWGVTPTEILSKTLKVIKLTRVPNDECQTQLLAIDKRVTIFDTQMCANGTGVCAGDGGGPLTTLNEGERFVQFGVVSYGEGRCDNESRLNVFTKVESYIDWIFDKMEN